MEPKVGARPLLTTQPSQIEVAAGAVEAAVADRLPILSARIEELSAKGATLTRAETLELQDAMQEMSRLGADLSVAHDARRAEFNRKFRF